MTFKANLRLAGLSMGRVALSHSESDSRRDPRVGPASSPKSRVLRLQKLPGASNMSFFGPDGAHGQA